MKTRDIRINKEFLAKYEPCKDSYDNFNDHYTDISIMELINSTKISYNDKIWLLQQIVPDELLILWAIDSAFVAYAHASNYNEDTHYAESAAVGMQYAETSAGYAGNTISDDNLLPCGFYAMLAAYSAAQAGEKWRVLRERLQSLLYFIETEGEV